MSKGIVKVLARTHGQYRDLRSIRKWYLLRETWFAKDQNKKK